MARRFRFALLVILGSLASGGIAIPQAMADSKDDAVAEASDPMCEVGPDGLMCCDQPSRPRDSLHTVSKSALTAGTAAAGLAVAGLLIKRRRKG